MSLPWATADRRYHWKAMRLRLGQRLTDFWPLWLLLLGGRAIEIWLGSPVHGVGLSGVIATGALGWLIVEAYRVTASRT